MKSTPCLLLLVSLVGCADLNEPESATDTAVRTLGPLHAPRGAAFGQVRAGSTSELQLELDNTGRTEVLIRQVSILPPDPYDAAFVPPDPCYPPDPFRVDLTRLTPRMIAPCVLPASATSLPVIFAPTVAGGFAAGIRVDYVTADGSAYTLTIPATACVAR